MFSVLGLGQLGRLQRNLVKRSSLATFIKKEKTSSSSFLKSAREYFNSDILSLKKCFQVTSLSRNLAESKILPRRFLPEKYKNIKNIEQDLKLSRQKDGLFWGHRRVCSGLGLLWICRHRGYAQTRIYLRLAELSSSGFFRHDSKYNLQGLYKKLRPKHFVGIQCGRITLRFVKVSSPASPEVS